MPVCGAWQEPWGNDGQKGPSPLSTEPRRNGGQKGPPPLSTPPSALSRLHLEGFLASPCQPGRAPSSHHHARPRFPKRPALHPTHQLWDSAIFGHKARIKDLRDRSRSTSQSAEECPWATVFSELGLLTWEAAVTRERPV